MLRWPCVFLRHDCGKSVSPSSLICFEVTLGPGYSDTRARIDAACRAGDFDIERLCGRGKSSGGDTLRDVPIHMASHDPRRASRLHPPAGPRPGPGTPAGIAPG